MSKENSHERYTDAIQEPDRLAGMSLLQNCQIDGVSALLRSQNTSAIEFEYRESDSRTFKTQVDNMRVADAVLKALSPQENAEGLLPALQGLQIVIKNCSFDAICLTACDFISYISGTPISDLNIDDVAKKMKFLIDGMKIGRTATVIVDFTSKNGSRESLCFSPKSGSKGDVDISLKHVKDKEVQRRFDGINLDRTVAGS